MESLHSMVQQCVTVHTHKVAVMFDDGKDVAILTYGEMWQRAVLISKVLQNHGVSDQIVGICIPPSQNLPSTILGVLCSSSAVYPFESDGLGFVKQSILKMHVSFLLLHISSLSDLETLIGLFGGKILHSVKLTEFGLVLIHLTRIKVCENPAALAYCLTTSGTTAEPKIVRVPHSCIVPNVEHLRSLFEVSSEDITLLASPLTFDPCVIDLFVTLTSGATLLIIPNAIKLSPQQLTTVISKQNKVTILQVTPALLCRFSASQLRSSLLSATTSLRILAVGGERFPSLRTVKTWRDENNKTKLYNLYGITELSCWATVQEITPFLLEEGVEEVPLGQPLCETVIKVLDEKGQIVQEGEGHMFIGSSTRHCYVDDEEVDKEAGHELKWRETGDLVRVRADGTVVYLCRTDDQVKRNGKRLNTKVIEEVILSNLGDVKDCRVMLVDSELVVFVSSDKPSSTTFSGKVLQCVKETLPRHCWPDRVCLLQNIPLTQHGKTDISALMQVAREPHQLSDLPSEEKLTEWAHQLWKDLLSASNRIDVNVDVEGCDNFINIGGDSFKAVQLVNTVERCFDTRLPSLLETVLNKTFSDFVRFLKIIYSYSLNKNGDTVQVKNLNMVQENYKTMQVGNGETLQVTNSETVQVTNSETLQVTNSETVQVTNSETLQVKNSETVQVTNSETLQVTNSETLQVTNSETLHVTNSEILQVTNSETLQVKNSETRQMTNDEIIQEINDETGQVTNDETVQVTKSETVQMTNGETLQKINSETVQMTNGHCNLTNNENAVSAHMKCNKTSCKRFKRQHQHAVTDLKCRCTQPSCQCCAGGQTVSFFGYAARGNRTSSFCKDIVSHDCVSYNTSRGKLHVELSWKQDTGKCVDASPLIALDRAGNHIVLMGSHSHLFIAVHVLSGRVMWRTQLGDRIESSACLSVCARWVTVGCYDGCLYVLNVSTGEIKWKFHTGGPIKSSPTADTKTSFIIFGSHDQHLFAIDLQREECVWKCHLGGGSIFSSPVLDEEQRIACVGTLAGNLVAVNIDTGQVHWTYDAGKPIFSSPVIVFGCVVVGCVDGKVHCVSRTGRQTWTFETHAPVFSSAAVCKQHASTSFSLLIGSHDKHLYCLSEQGKELWRFRANSCVYSTPTVLSCTRHHWMFGVNHLYTAKTESSQRNDHNKTNSCKQDNIIKLCKQNISQHTVHIKDYANQSNKQTEISKSINCKENFNLIVTPTSENINCKTDLVLQVPTTSVEDLSKKYFETIETSLITTGNLSAPTTPFLSPPPVCVPPVACCASTGGCLFFLDMSSGKCLANVELKGEVFSSPVSTDQYVVVGCRDNHIYCFKYAWT